LWMRTQTVCRKQVSVPGGFWPIEPHAPPLACRNPRPAPRGRRCRRFQIRKELSAPGAGQPPGRRPRQATPKHPGLVWPLEGPRLLAQWPARTCEGYLSAPHEGQPACRSGEKADAEDLVGVGVRERKHRRAVGHFPNLHLAAGGEGSPPPVASNCPLALKGHRGDAVDEQGRGFVLRADRSLQHPARGFRFHRPADLSAETGDQGRPAEA